MGPGRCVAFVAATLCCGTVWAETTPAGRSLADHLARGDELLGDPGGARSALELVGVDLRLFYNQYLSVKPSGGGANPSRVFGHSGSYDLFARVDAEELLGWPGGSLLFHAKGQYDRGLNADVGALSDPIDDADFDSPIYVDELWLQQAFLAGRIRLRAGFSEQQTAFDRNAYANSEDRQFLSAFLDNNAVLPLPNGLAATLMVTPTRWLGIALGVSDADNSPRSSGLDTIFDGVDSLTGHLEATLRSPLESRGLPGDYRLGGFLDGRARREFATGRLLRGHFGAYISLDQRLWGAEGRASPSVGAFARLGWADPDVNRVEWFWSLGFEWRGPLPGRTRDVIGVGTYQTIGSEAYRAAVDPRFGRETGIEFYYAIRALGWLVVTPDLQVVIDPGATGAAADAVVGTLRVRVIF